MKNLLFGLMVLFGVTLAANAATDEVQEKVSFATDATYPPFESSDASGQLKGFDIEVIKALCQQMKTKCVFVNQPWDSLIPSLQMGKFDVMFGAMNITAAREKQVDFTIPYYLNSAAVVAAKSKNLTLDPNSLDGKTIGVLASSTFIPYLQEKYGNKVKINTYASEQTAFLDLTSGRIDAVMGDTPLIKTWLKQHEKDYALVGQPISDEKYFGKGYGLAVCKGNTKLVDQLNAAIKAIQANGTYNKIETKYFGK